MSNTIMERLESGKELEPVYIHRNSLISEIVMWTNPPSKHKDKGMVVNWWMDNLQHYTVYLTEAPHHKGPINISDSVTIRPGILSEIELLTPVSSITHKLPSGTWHVIYIPYLGVLICKTSTKNILMLLFVNVSEFKDNPDLVNSIKTLAKDLSGCGSEGTIDRDYLNIKQSLC